jgi:hypothetical protein
LFWLFDSEKEDGDSFSDSNEEENNKYETFIGKKSENNIFWYNT